MGEFLRKHQKLVSIIFIVIVAILYLKDAPLGRGDDLSENAQIAQLVEEKPEVEIKYSFRNKALWEEHFEKHGEEFPYDTKEDYLIGANVMMANDNKLHKKEKEDGDDVYYLEETNEFIIISKDGYLRTYFKPTKGKKYFDKQ